MLHIGHWYAFAVPDVFARLQRMRGYNVLFPMGFDAFGLPAENAAIRHNIHPATWTFENIATMRQQYRQMGAMIDWSREIATCTPDYYRWNQWFFLRMLERGLAYRAKGAVWWCPKDQTVLANEQVLEGNVCERCGTRGLSSATWSSGTSASPTTPRSCCATPTALDWPERVKTMQRNWIGRSEGARLRLHAGDRRRAGGLHHPAGHGLGRDLHGAGAGAPAGGEDHHARAREARSTPTSSRRGGRPRSSACRPTRRGQRTGVFTGGYAVNPVTDERIPVWIADYVLMGYGTGAIMAVPSGDQRDFEFARAFDLPIRVVVQPEGYEPRSRSRRR